LPGAVSWRSPDCIQWWFRRRRGLPVRRSPRVASLPGLSVLCGGLFREIDGNAKCLSYDGKICVIVIEECYPHLFLFCAKFRSCHENAFLVSEQGGCDVATATLGVAIRRSLILVRGWLQYSALANLTNRGVSLPVPSPSWSGSVREIDGNAKASQPRVSGWFAVRRPMFSTCLPD
jgi:hypothetical protein